jgi:hypothetical protein
MMFRLNVSMTSMMKNYDEMLKHVFSLSLGPLDLAKLGRAGYYFGNLVLQAKAFFLLARISAKPLEGD